MSLNEKIPEDIKQAMRQGQRERVTILRTLQAAIKNREIELKKRDEGLGDSEVVEVVGREVKKVKDSIEQFSKAGRQDLVEASETELQIMMTYMPEQIGEDQIRDAVKEAIEDAGAAGMGDLGKVMKAVMPVLKGKADGSVVNKVVREELESL